MLIYSLKPVKGKKNIDKIFSNAFKFYEKDAVIFVCNGDKLENNDEPKTRTISFLVAVRKKDAKKAVIRNRIKRLLRESIRQEFKQMGEQGIVSDIESLAIIWGKVPEYVYQLRLSDVQPVVSKLISRSLAENKYKI